MVTWSQFHCNRTLRRAQRCWFATGQDFAFDAFWWAAAPHLQKPGQKYLDAHTVPALRTMLDNKVKTVVSSPHAVLALNADFYKPEGVDEWFLLITAQVYDGDKGIHTVRLPVIEATDKKKAVDAAAEIFKAVERIGATKSQVASLCTDSGENHYLHAFVEHYACGMLITDP